MHSPRKVNLGRRNGLAMLQLLGKPLPAHGFAQSGSIGPVLQSATIAKQPDGSSYQIEISFKASTADNLHFAGAACCTICCATQNGSAIKLRVVNDSDPSGYTWQRSEVPTVVSGSSTVAATFRPSDPAALVATDMLQFMYEGEPECALYNGIGGPDNATAIAASPFYVSLDPGSGQPTIVPATPCAVMLRNGSCYFAPEPCSGCLPAC